MVAVHLGQPDPEALHLVVTKAWMQPILLRGPVPCKLRGLRAEGQGANQDIGMCTCKRSCKACGQASRVAAAAPRSEPSQRLLVHVKGCQLNCFRWHRPQHICNAHLCSHLCDVSWYMRNITAQHRILTEIKNCVQGETRWPHQWQRRKGGSDVMSPASLPLKNPRRPPRSYVLRMISITVPCSNFADCSPWHMGTTCRSTTSRINSTVL